MALSILEEMTNLEVGDLVFWRYKHYPTVIKKVLIENVSKDRAWGKDALFALGIKEKDYCVASYEVLKVVKSNDRLCRWKTISY